MTSTLAERSARRMLRRSRRLWTALAVTAAALAVAVVVVEMVRSALGLSPWLASPTGILDLVASGSPGGLAVAAVAVVFAVACLWGALTPARAGRRLVRDDRAPLVIDDAVIAGSLSRSAGRAAGVGTGQVRTHVARRRADIEVTPSSGFAVTGAEVETAGNGGISGLGLEPALRARARISASGVLS